MEYDSQPKNLMSGGVGYMYDLVQWSDLPLKLN